MNKKRYNHGYNIYKKYDITDIFNSIESENQIPDKIIYNSKDYDDSLKRATIMKQLIERDGNKCKYCLEKPEFFALGKDNANYWHLDLYSIKEEELYMYTIDHIHPKSKGGENKIENYQILCKTCNENKSDTIEGEVKEPKHKVEAFNYINNKLKTLNDQTKGILSKILHRKVILVKEQKNFTVGRTYPVLYISVTIDKDLNSVYKFHTTNDNNNIVLCKFDNFLTKKDSEHYLNNRFSKY